jgi:1-acyl-sn-glycerol-3-phosphate acyltransferase
MSTDCQEVSRVVTRSAVIIKTQKDGNKVIYFPDGTITRTDLKQGIWVTTNPKGVVRERNLKLNSV